MAWAMVVVAPTASKVRSASMVCVLFSGSSTWSAPILRAISFRFSRGSMTIISLGSCNRTQSRILRPIIPAPIIRTRDFRALPPLRTACKPTESGSNMAAILSGRPSGMRLSAWAGTQTKSAIAPSRRKRGVLTPKTVRSEQRFTWPEAHSEHLVHPTVESKQTSSPASNPFEVFSTRPAASCPIISGGRRRPVVPVYPCTSDPQIPTASIRTSTSWGSGCGSGTCCRPIWNAPV